MLGCIQPMSSPMMKRMLGFDCCCAWAKLGAPGKDANKSEAASMPNSRRPDGARVVLVLPGVDKGVSWSRLDAGPIGQCANAGGMTSLPRREVGKPLVSQQRDDRYRSFCCI